ncbi:STAS domain-containing protein [Anaerolineales bacterium HSG6]|nr:STAS domain-containing protein [Anaerolineales bacterium HSG6]
MELNDVLLTDTSITRLTSALLAGILTFFLWQIKGKSPAVNRLLWGFVWLTITYAMFFFPGLISYIKEPSLVISLMMTLLFLAQFAYFLPEHDQPLESRIVLGISVMFVMVEIGIGGYYSYLSATGHPDIILMLTMNGLMFIVIPVAILFTIGVIIRQAIHRMTDKPAGIWAKTSYILRGLIFPPNHDVQTLRNFCFGFFMGLMPGIAEPLYQSGLISTTVAIYLVEIGSLIMIFILFFSYINHASEQISFTVKLVSIPLFTVLIIFGTAGFLITNQLNNRLEEERQLSLSLVYEALVDQQLTNLPDEVAYIVSRPTSDGEYTVEFDRPNFDLQLLVEQDQVRQEIPILFEPLVEVTTSSVFVEHTGIQLESLYRFYPKLYLDNPLYYSYTFDQNGILYEVGFFDQVYDQIMHDIVIRLIRLILLSSLLIVTVYSAVFRQILVRPVENLSAGVKQVEVGEREVMIPIQYEDEIGFLTGAFNRLTSTIQQAEAETEQSKLKLVEMNQQLETKVTERTAQLEAETQEREKLQQKVIEAQQQAIRDLSSPIIPVLNGVIVSPLVGTMDVERVKDLRRSLLQGIHDHQAKIVILDLTGISVISVEVATALDKVVQAVRLKGSDTIITGISEHVAETIVELGINWTKLETVRDLQTGLIVALNDLGFKIRVDRF